MKKVLKRFVPVIVILINVFHTYAQSAKHRIQILDNNTVEPVPGVLLIVKGYSVANSDKNGYLDIPDTLVRNNKYLLLYKNDYQPDTINTIQVPTEKYLIPLQGRLAEVTITDEPVQRISKSWNEFVTDYAFVGENILISSYRGYNGKQSRLVLLNSNWDTVMISDETPSADAIFRSCVGKYYMVSTNAIYPIIFNSYNKKITLGTALSYNEYRMLQSCELFLDNTYYYKYADPATFHVAFAMARQGEEKLRILKKMERPEIANASIENLVMALNEPDPKIRAQLFFLRRMLDKGAFKRMDVGLYAKGDSLVVFDFDDEQIYFYSYTGNLLQKVPIQFDDTKNLKLKIIQDQGTGDFYFLEESAAHNTIRKIDLQAGDVSGPPIVLNNLFAEDIKIRNKEVYYLWQKSGMPMQLFTEQNNIK